MKLTSGFRLLTLTFGLAFIGSAAQAADTTSSAQKNGAGTQPVGPYKDFKGDIKLDVRDSKADWGPFAPKKAPEGAPNVLFVLYYLAVIASI